MQTINYKSDFDFILRLYACGPLGADSRQELGFPDYDWTARIWTGVKANAYVVSCIGGKCVNCFNDEGRIHVVMNSHHLTPGELQIEFTALLPDDMYPDGDERHVIPAPLGVILTKGAAPGPSQFEVEIMLPYIKFRYEDLTEEEKAEMGRPAVEAAAAALSAAESADSAATEARSATERAVAATEAAEKAESATVEAEALRKAAEDERAAAESERVKAESERAETFAGYRKELDDKADRSELSPIVGEPAADAPEAADPDLVTTALRKVAQTLTPAEQEQVKANIGIYKAELFDDLWRAAVGEHGTVDHSHYEDGIARPYGLNRLWLTYDEAQAVYAAGPVTSMYSSLRYTARRIRTNLPAQCSSWLRGSTAQAFVVNWFVHDSAIEVLNLHTPAGVFCIAPATASDVNRVDFHAPALRTVLGVVDAGKYTGALSHRLFGACPLLEDISIQGLRANLDISGLPRISAGSLAYLIAKAAPTEAITVTVHPDVYARLADPAADEWHAVLTAAVAKNISFATK